MGAGPSVLANELNKPHDCSDVQNEEEAKKEIIRLRKLLRDNQRGLESAISATGQALPKESSSLASRGRPAKFERFDSVAAEEFHLENSPELSDYLVNEFHRFQVSTSDQRLSWDGFWRFTRDLDFGLSDMEIAELRQQADKDMDGYIDWHEMVEVFLPLLGKFWQAKLANSPEYEKWEKLHWETQYTVKKTLDGYTRRGKTFWVNKITGESTWTMPNVLESHPSYVDGIAAKKKRHQEAAPSLDEFVRSAYEHHSKKGHMTFSQFWEAFDGELHLTNWLKEHEKKKLAETIDKNHDGDVSYNEFVDGIVPLMKEAFNSRGGPEWIALETTYEGLEYLYWVNRITNESSWFPPQN